jgi:hypothetical protein
VFRVLKRASGKYLAIKWDVRLWALVIALGTQYLVAAQSSGVIDVERSLVWIISNDGQCNGVLLDHPEANLRNFVLSADHCFRSEIGSLEFIFAPGSLIPNLDVQRTFWSTDQYQVLARSPNQDYVLFEITDTIPSYLMTYASGWSTSAVAPLSTFGLHVLDGQVFSNSDYDRPKNRTIRAIAEYGGEPVPEGGWYIEKWENGYTAPGSSGSPLFDQWSYLIGILSAGSSTEELPFSDYYTKFDIMNKSSKNDTGLSRFMGIDASEAAFLEGRNASDDVKLANYSEGFNNQLDFQSGLEIREDFMLSEPSSLKGVYVTAAEVIPTDLVNIVIWVDEEIVYEQLVFTGFLDVFSENYIELDSSIVVEGKVSVEIENNRSIQVVQAITNKGGVEIDNVISTTSSVFMALHLDEYQLVVEKITDEELLIYPVPSGENLFVVGIKRADELTFYDMQGQVVSPIYTIDYQGRHLFNFGQLPSGIYFCRIGNKTYRTVIDKK